MHKDNRTKNELLKELATLRQRIDKLKKEKNYYNKIKKESLDSKKDMMNLC